MSAQAIFRVQVYGQRECLRWLNPRLPVGYGDAGLNTKERTGWNPDKEVRILLSADELEAMKDFSNAAFSPDVIEIMTSALQAAIDSLPEPVSSTQVNRLAESILRTAQAGERDVAALRVISLMELQLAPRTAR